MVDSELEVMDFPDLQLRPGACDKALDSMYNQQKEGLFTDFTITVNDQQIQCHRNVLAAASQFFHKLLTSNMKEAREQEVALDAFRYEDILNVVKFCYHQEVVISFKDIQPCFEAFDYCQLNCYKKFFVPYLVQHINPANCLGWCAFAEKHSLSYVEATAWKVIHNQLQEVIRHKEFLELSFGEVVSLFQSKGYQHQDAILQGCVCWIQAQKNDIKLISFLEYIGVAKCSLAYLLDLSACEHETFMDDASYIAISKAAMSKSRKKNTVLLVSGRTTGYKMSPECNSLNLSTGQLSEVTTLPGLVSSLSVCKTPHGFAVIGKNESTPEMLCFLYNHQEYTWSELPSPPADEGSVITCVGSTLFVLGSKTSTCTDGDDVRAYYMTDTVETWQSCQPMSDSMQHPIVAIVDATIYVVWNTEGNNTDTQGYTDELPLQSYEVPSDNWSYCQDLPPGANNTEGASAVGTSKHLYLLGGGGHLALRYCPAEDQWSKLSRPITLHIHGSAAVVDDTIILCGGLQDPMQVSDAVESYNALQDTWEVKTKKLPSPLWHHFICSI